MADRLAAARLRLMVGRRAEIALFRRALRAGNPPFAVLHLHGTGGIGKTTLLQRFQSLAREAGRPVAWLSGRDIDPTPENLQRQLGPTARLPPDLVLLIDGYEHMAPLDSWLRECLLPELPGHSLTVLAGRGPPSTGWLADSAWGEISRHVTLRNLRSQESRRYLRLRGVAEAHHQQLLSFTYGHPLALSLAADVLAQKKGNVAFDLRRQHAVIGMLLERLLQQLPGPAYRRALEICAHARFTTETLLAQVLERPEDAPTMFNWLRGLSLVEHGERGLCPHDLVRDALDYDLRWRAPEDYHALHARVRDAVIRRFRSNTGTDQQDAFFDLLFLHRHSPSMRPYYDWKFSDAASIEAAQTVDHPAILGLVRRLEGAPSAALAAHWLAMQPHAFSVFRDRHRKLLAVAQLLVLRAFEATDLALDPALRLAHAHARRHAPLRPGEALLLQRYWPVEGGGPGSTSYNLLALLSTRYWLGTPRLAWAFIVTPDGERLEPMFNHLGFFSIGEEAGDLGPQLFARDWRLEPGAAWLESMAERELATRPSQVSTHAPVEPTFRLVLSEPDFAIAVRQALKDFHQPAALADNPLLRSRVMLDATPDPTQADLQAILRAGLEELRSTPRGEKPFRALWHTYIQPASSQEIAAERLQLPFNTYRYHLYQGIARLTAWLWHRELHGDDTTAVA
ncbi:MAG: hypothetical protein JJU06_05220 [Ectothiorhodospiraceae bacterium]|nr:hypothetical protein [Ectothiorhodospiraceae bacterium]